MNQEAVIRQWQESVQDEELRQELEELLACGEQSRIDDAFFQNLAFGTAGLRGILGVGTNRMNIYTVAQATQGLADYLNAHFENPSVAICRDSRLKGELFVRTAARVLAGNGVRALLYPRVEPTPALSWAVRDLNCSAGINVTASHNPANYNGYKAYGADGCQITSQAAKEIQDAIDRTDPFADVKYADFDSAFEQGLIAWIGEDTLDRYIDAVAAQSLEPLPSLGSLSAAEAAATQQPATEGVPLQQSATEELSVVYTALSGVGLECVSRILERAGIRNIHLVEEQVQPDGTFRTCPKPNPEIREALEQGLALCENVHPDLLLATDPDADRMGIAVENQGEYMLLSGNEVGILMLDYA